MLAGMARIARCAAVLAVSTVVAACGFVLPFTSPTDEVHECPLIGCDSQVVFEIDYDLRPGGEYLVEACVEADCERARIRVPSGQGGRTVGDLVLSAIDDVVVFVLHGEDYSGSHAVSLTVESPDQGTITVEEEIEFERTQPNGPECEPVCWSATIQRI